MKKVAVFPGSFNPFHEGHLDVVRKALAAFDEIIIVAGVNPEKGQSPSHSEIDPDNLLGPIVHGIDQHFENEPRLKYDIMVSTLRDYIQYKNQCLEPHGKKVVAVIRGIRNGQDLEYERTQQYWNEDLGISVPTAYFVTDRKLVHVSSTAKRILTKMGLTVNRG